jgi:hypothetical protein
MDLNDDVGIQAPRVFVIAHREQARSYIRAGLFSEVMGGFRIQTISRQKFVIFSP